MKSFINSLFDKNQQINFNYLEYETIFVREKYRSYYLFFFLNDEKQLIELLDNIAELFYTIRNNKDIYEVDMDKNITCIYCLCVADEMYYEAESTGTISELSKTICYVEENLNYFKKNVLLYTGSMEEYAKENVGKFHLLCQAQINESSFQEYKKSNKDFYKYDFLINLFIKLPFLYFQKYQLNNKEEYKSVRTFINEIYDKKEIDIGLICNKVDKLEEKIDDEDILFAWLDELVKEKLDF